MDSVCSVHRTLPAAESYASMNKLTNACSTRGCTQLISTVAVARK